MQNYCKTIGALAAASALVAGNASAEVNYELHGGYTNQYIFRGMDTGNDLTEVGVDLTTEINGFGVSAGVWHGTFESNGQQVGLDTQDVAELDLYGEVSKEIGYDITAAVGYIAYTYDSNINDTQEAYGSLRRDLGFAEASLTYYLDVRGENDGYTELALSRSFELSPCLSLGLKSALGYAIEDGEVANWTTSAKLNWAFTETATLSPFVAVSVEGGADDIYESNNEVELVGGSMLTVKF